MWTLWSARSRRCSITRKRFQPDRVDREIVKINRAFALGDVRKAADLLREAAACLMMATRHGTPFGERITRISDIEGLLRKIYREM